MSNGVEISIPPCNPDLFVTLRPREGNAPSAVISYGGWQWENIPAAATASRVAGTDGSAGGPGCGCRLEDKLPPGAAPRTGWMALGFIQIEDGAFAIGARRSSSRPCNSTRRREHRNLAAWTTKASVSILVTRWKEAKKGWALKALGRGRV